MQTLTELLRDIRAIMQAVPVPGKDRADQDPDYQALRAKIDDIVMDRELKQPLAQLLTPQELRDLWDFRVIIHRACAMEPNAMRKEVFAGYTKEVKTALTKLEVGPEVEPIIASLFATKVTR